MFSPQFLSLPDNAKSSPIQPLSYTSNPKHEEIYRAQVCCTFLLGLRMQLLLWWQLQKVVTRSDTQLLGGALCGTTDDVWTYPFFCCLFYWTSLAVENICWHDLPSMYREIPAPVIPFTPGRFFPHASNSKLLPMLWWYCQIKYWITGVLAARGILRNFFLPELGICIAFTPPSVFFPWWLCWPLQASITRTVSFLTITVETQ